MFIKSVYVAILRFRAPLVTQNVILISLYNQSSLVRSSLIDLIHNDLPYYPFVVSVDRYNGCCDTLDDLSGNLWTQKRQM